MLLFCLLYGKCEGTSDITVQSVPLEMGLAELGYCSHFFVQMPKWDRIRGGTAIGYLLCHQSVSVKNSSFPALNRSVAVCEDIQDPRGEDSV